jgi:dihydrofolate synthase/folylpolyglutamate synthase
MAWLGKTLREIASHKAGIIKHNGTVVLYPQIPEVEQVFFNECKAKNAQLIKVGKPNLVENNSCMQYQEFNYRTFKNLRIKLLGEHQIFNAATAAEACLALNKKGYNISERHIRDGLEAAVWPGRLEILSTDPIILIDGAHNIEGGQSLKSALDRYFGGYHKVFVIGFLRDKAYSEIIQLIAKKDDIIITLTPNNNRALTSKQLCDILRERFNNVYDGITPENGLKLALESAQKHSMICAFGSLYMIGAFKQAYSNYMQGGTKEWT